MKQWLTLGLAFGLGLAFADGASAQVKLGVAGPLTGGSAAFGAQLKNGVEQAVEDINAAGGILGQKVQVFVGDDRADPKEGVSVANKFVGDGVKFVVGHFNSGVTIPASEVYQENGILEITPAATNPRVTERNMWNIFRTCGRDDQQGAVAGDYILKNFKGKKIAIVHDKTTYGQGLADVTRATINKGGLKEVLYEGVNKDDKDFSALVSKIKASNADLIYWGGLHDTGGLILRQVRAQGVKAPLMGGDGITDDEFAAIAGPGAEGTLMTQLCRRADHQAGGRGGEIARSEKGGRTDQIRHEVQDRDRRTVLRQEGGCDPPRLHGLCLEEGSQRQDHLHRDRVTAAARAMREARLAPRRAFA